MSKQHSTLLAKTNSFIVKFHFFDKVECCFDIVAVFGKNVERNFVLSTKSKQIEHVQFVSQVELYHGFCHAPRYFFCFLPSGRSRSVYPPAFRRIVSYVTIMICDFRPSSATCHRCDDVPVTVIYLGLTMTLGTASVCLTVLVLNLHYRATFVPVPGWVRPITFVSLPGWVRLVFLRHGARLLGFCDHRTSALLEPPSVVTSPAAAVGGESKTATSNEPSPAPSSPPPLFVRRPPPSRRRTSLAVSVGDLRRTSDSALDHGKALRPGTPAPDGAVAAGTGRNNSYCRMIAEREDNTSSTGSRRVSPICLVAPADHVIAGSGRSLAGDESRDLEAILHEWQLLARVLDRIFFVVCSTIMLASALLILLSPWYARGQQIVWLIRPTHVTDPRDLHAHVIRPHRLPEMSHAARSLCLYVSFCVLDLGTRVSCAKTAEPIEMPFWGTLTRVGPRNRALDGWRSRSPREGALFRGTYAGWPGSL